jgi:hypothetical protein
MAAFLPWGRLWECLNVPEVVYSRDVLISFFFFKKEKDPMVFIEV